MNYFFTKSGELLNPSVQIDTSLYAMEKNGTELEDTGEPVFDEEGQENGAAFNMFREMDPLYYKDFNPKEVKAQRELERSKDLSGKQAANINAVKTN